MKSCTGNSESTVASSNPQTIGGVEKRVSGYILTALDHKGKERALVRVEYFTCSELADLLLEWHSVDRDRTLFIRPDEATAKAASTIEHQLSVIGELREALKDILPLAINDGPGGCDGKTAGCPQCAAIKRARKALSHPIIGDKS